MIEKNAETQRTRRGAKLERRGSEISTSALVCVFAYVSFRDSCGFVFIRV
jgi:hypothetical protein